LKIVFAAVFVTSSVIAIGFLLVSPMFFGNINVETKQQIMLSFSVMESSDCVDWCSNLSSILKAYDIGATVFFVGSVAEQHPECVSFFTNKVDIGSQAFSTSDLTSIADYSAQLEEIRRGKLAVDTAGNLNSKVFRAPNGATDQNIYSLLSRNDILADFSYDHQYNVFSDGQFIRFDALIFKGATVSANSILTLEKTSQPVIIDFDNGYSTEIISELVGKLKTGQFDFVNASELTGINLTERAE
jgi:peptidoglycan/xylan/chitin deacetylase (PgdA/CDA1 family)